MKTAHTKADEISIPYDIHFLADFARDVSAGLGSRYGGLKQLDPVGPFGAGMSSTVIQAPSINLAVSTCPRSRWCRIDRRGEGVG
jgi:hypothetical protein